MKRTFCMLISFLSMAVVLLVLTGDSTGESLPEVELVSPGCGEEIENPVVLNWSASDDDGDELVFDVYLDTERSPETKVASEIQETSYSPEYLTSDVKYYWKVVAKDGYGENNSETWNFTFRNTPPEVVLIHPMNDTHSGGYYITLSWIGTDADNDSLSYDIFLDTEPSPQRLIGTTEDTKYYPEALALGEIYYWKIKADDGYHVTESEICTFHIYSNAKELEEYNVYGSLAGNGEDILEGGRSFSFKMLKGDKLKVDIFTSPPYNYNTDFYLVEAKELRKWQWGAKNEPLEHIQAGTTEDANSINYQFTAPDDGIYCVIVDDSEMGKAPPVNDPGTPEDEVLKINYIIKLEKKGSGTSTTSGSEDDSSDIFLYLTIFIVLLVPAFTTLWVYSRPADSKEVESKIEALQKYRALLSQAHSTSQQQLPSNQQPSTGQQAFTDHHMPPVQQTVPGNQRPPGSQNQPVSQIPQEYQTPSQGKQGTQDNPQQRGTENQDVK